MENGFIKGRLYATNDQGAIPDAMTRGIQVVALVDVAQTQIYKQRGCLVISSLLPPPEAITDIINGNLPLGIQKYKAYLADPAQEAMIVCLLAAIVQKPRPLLLYCEYDPDVEFHILETLYSFFLESFGVVIGWYGDPRRPATSIKDNRFSYSLADLLFVNNYISRVDYAKELPADAIPSARACQALLRTVNYGFQTMEDCVRVCMSMVEDLRTQGEVALHSPMGFTKADLSSKAMEEIRKRKIEEQVLNAGNVVTGK